MPSFNFDAANHVATNLPTLGPLQKGMYEVMVVASDLKRTQAGTGEFIELTLQVVSGQHAGRRLWDRLNVRNPSKQAEDIALRNLQALCLACHLETMTDTEQLHDIPVLAQVDFDRKDATRNRIVFYGAVSSAVNNAATIPAASKPPTRPWERR